jgi:hypothetical protein
MRILTIVFCLGVLSPSLALAAEPATPNFLSGYYADALMLDGKPLRLITKGETIGVERACDAGVGDCGAATKCRAEPIKGKGGRYTSERNPSSNSTQLRRG